MAHALRSFSVPLMLASEGNWTLSVILTAYLGPTERPDNGISARSYLYHWSHRSNFPREAPNRRRLFDRIALDLPQSMFRQSIF